MPSTNMINLSERESLILATPAFRDLNTNEISQLASIMQEISVAPGEIVTQEGELIDAVYIIAEGTLEVTKQVIINEKTGSTFLAILNPGESIGLKEVGLFAKTGRRTATVTAATACVLLKIEIKDLDAFLDSHPQSLQAMRASTDLMLRMQFIKDSNPFIHLSNQRIAWLATSVKTLQVKAGDILFKEGDAADNCYMIVDGTVEITQAKDNQSKVIDTLKAGQLFGEQALFKNAKRATTARAATDCDLMVLDQDTLEELKDESQGASGTIFSQLSEYNQPIRMENIIYHQRKLDDGQIVTTLKDPSRNQYFQLNEEGWYLWQLLNGQMTIQEITQQFSQHYHRFDPQTVINIISSIVDAGFAKADIQSELTSSNIKNASEVKKFVDRFRWIYAVKNPDSKVSKLYNYFGFIFYSIPALIIITISTLAGILALPYLLEPALQTIHNSNHLISLLIWLILLTATLQLVNPLAKGLTIKFFKHSVPHFALGFNFFLPTALVDTSDLWASSRFVRSITMASGIIATLFIGSLLSLYAYFYPNSTFAFTASMCALLLYFSTLRSLDPLLDSDGYQTLVTALDAHKLRESAFNRLINPGKQLIDRRKSELPQKNRNIFFIYYFIYILLNILFIFLIQREIKQYGLLAPWNSNLIYACLLLGLFFEWIAELSNQKK